MKEEEGGGRKNEWSGKEWEEWIEEGRKGRRKMREKKECCYCIKTDDRAIIYIIIMVTTYRLLNLSQHLKIA